MIKQTFIMATMLCAGVVCNAGTKHNIDSLIAVLDNEVENYNRYIQAHYQSIDELKSDLRYARTTNKMFDLNKSLFSNIRPSRTTRQCIISTSVSNVRERWDARTLKARCWQGKRSSRRQ